MKFIETIDSYLDIDRIGDFSTVQERVRLLTPERLNSLVLELWRDLPRPTKTTSRNSFVANSTLSGLPFPCAGFDCRKTSLEQIIGFAAIYSDQTVLFNPFERLLVPEQRLKAASDSARYRDEVAFHVAEIMIARPLIERGILLFAEEETLNLCSSCFRKALEVLRSGNVGEFGRDRMYFELLDRFAKGVTAVVEKPGKRSPQFVLNGPEEFLGHSQVHAWPTRKPNHYFQLGQTLSQDEILQVGIGEDFAHYTTSDLMRSASLTTSLGYGNVMATTSHVAVMRSYFGDAYFSRTVDFEYPMLSGANLGDILSFRDQEWHHLHSFRTMVDEGLKAGKDVELELLNSSARIEGLIARNARTLNRDLAAEAVVTTAGVAATLATSGLSSLLAAAVGAIGGRHLIKSMVPKLIERFAEPEAVRDETSYYAWKIKKKRPI